jgi:hypothetical protein
VLAILLPNGFFLSHSTTSQVKCLIFDWYCLFIFNRNLVDTRWQQYSTRLHTNTRWQQYSTHLHTNTWWQQ